MAVYLTILALDQENIVVLRVIIKIKKRKYLESNDLSDYCNLSNLKNNKFQNIPY